MIIPGGFKKGPNSKMILSITPLYILNKEYFD